eukprot:scaffold2945_cov244-Pinguiococcus_pyrenoidosus.AAC.9
MALQAAQLWLLVALALAASAGAFRVVKPRQAPAGAQGLRPMRNSALFVKSASEDMLPAEAKPAPKPASRVRLPDLSQKDFPPVPPDDEPFDLVVVGSGPGGEAAAVSGCGL